MSGMNFNVNTFDAIVFTVLGLSALVAFFRGFVRELLSLGAWVGAALVTIYLFPHSTEFMKHHIHGSHGDTIAAGVGALGTFIVAFICFCILNAVILRYVKPGSEVGLLDNFLGLIFGALRGAFIVSLGYLILQAAIPMDDPPHWLKGSITRSYVEYGADMLTSAAPTYLHDMEGFIEKEQEKAREERDSGKDKRKSFDEIIRERRND